MITQEQLEEYFASIGITLPSYLTSCIVDKANGTEQCMIDNGYSDCDIIMSLSLAGALIAISMGAKKVSSHSVDVVSESFRYESLEDLQDILFNNLRVSDPEGCTDDILPTKLNASFLFVTKSCKC